jgi:6,7-dimethyl-8-ribityllumazine synthase
MSDSIPPVAVIVSRYNDSITGPMQTAAVAAYERAGGDRGQLGLIDAPGAFDLTGICAAAASSGLYKGIVALGCVIKGDTRHDQYINEAVASGLTAITVKTGVPVAFGLLTVETREQAVERAGGKLGNKGEDAMLAVLESIAAIAAIEAGGYNPGLEYRLGVTPHDKDGA